MNQRTLEITPTLHPPPGGPGKNFLRARRHSRRVRMLKIGVPAAALLLVLVFAVWAWWSSLDGFVADISGAAVSDGKLVMTDATLNGFTRDNLPYSLSAERAIQEIGGTGKVELENIVAHVPLDAEIWADIHAQTGLYDNENKLLDITSAMTVTTTNGLIAHFNSARMDVRSGSLATEDPVSIEMQGSRLTAEGMQVLERGKVIVFEDRVRMHLVTGMYGMGRKNDE